MRGIDIKATIYDIFGYFVPGFLAITIIYLAYQHSFGVFKIGLLIDTVNSLRGTDLTFLFLIAYILGHSLSSLSSLILEKGFILRLKHLYGRLDITKLVSEALKVRLMDKYREVMNSELTDRDFRFLIAYVEAKQPAVYSTAFVYLAFYGMARTIALTFSIGFVWEVVNVTILGYKEAFIFTILYFSLFISFVYQYFRFLRYFREQIIMGFVLPS